MVKILKITLLLIVSSCFSNSYLKAQEVSDTLVFSTVEYTDSLDLPVNEGDTLPMVTHRQSRRIVAVLLCIGLGPFGMHRLYLGTEPQVAAAYALTLGGGFGFVTAVDLAFLLFSKDITRFKNNPHFIMWRKP